MKEKEGIYEHEIPEGARLSDLGVDIDGLTTLVGINLIGGGMWGDTPPPVPLGAVILIPVTRDGDQMEPVAIVQTAAKLRELRDQFHKVFSKAADAAEELFANDGELSAEKSADA